MPSKHSADQTANHVLKVSLIKQANLRRRTRSLSLAARNETCDGARQRKEAADKGSGGQEKAKRGDVHWTPKGRVTG